MVPVSLSGNRGYWNGIIYWLDTFPDTQLAVLALDIKQITILNYLY